MVAAITVTGVLPVRCRAGGRPRRAVRGRRVDTSRCRRDRRGRGRPTAAASGVRCHPRRGTSPAKGRPQKKAPKRAARGGSPPGGRGPPRRGGAGGGGRAGV